MPENCGLEMWASWTADHFIETGHFDMSQYVTSVLNRESDLAKIMTKSETVLMFRIANVCGYRVEFNRASGERRLTATKKYLRINL
jgi:hypothetical protein